MSDAPTPGARSSDARKRSATGSDAGAQSAGSPTAASGVSVRHGPTRLSGLAAIILSGVAVALVAAEIAGSWVAPFAAGLALLVAGDGLRDRESPVAAAACLGIGVVLGVAAIALGAREATDAGSLVRLVPGLAGVLLVAAGVVPLSGDGSRGLLRVGVGVVFLSVLAAGLLRAVAYPAMLAGVAAVVVAWDLGEHAIGLGEHLGRSAATRPVELVHGAGSLFVGAVAVAAGHVAADVGGAELPLASLLALLAAAALLALALHR